MRNKSVGKYLCGNCGNIFNVRITIGGQMVCPGCFNVPVKYKPLSVKQIKDLNERVLKEINYDNQNHIGK